jgi:hypothetical protein
MKRLLGLLLLAAFGSAGAAERWMLMERHGGCHDIGVLKRKVPELGDIRDPDAFVALMRKQGHEATTAPVPVPKGQAREVRVPAKELALLFVTTEMCSGK